MERDLDGDELRRYGRHLSLPGVGPAGQKRLLNAKVLVVGAGGLGSPALLYLAAAGVGTIGVIDPDVVELSNLQRQVLHAEQRCGTPKVDSAVSAIRELNSSVVVEPFEDRLTADNAVDLVARFDVVIDGSDNFATRHVVGDACSLAGVPCVWGSVFQFQGQVSVFPADGKPCYRCLYPEPPPTELAPSCAEGGVFGAICASVGSVQVAETLKLILGIGEPLIGRVWTHDGLGARTRVLHFPARDDCELCGPDAVIREVEEIAQVCAAGAPVPVIDADELRSRLASRTSGGPAFDLIDVREPFEWEIERIEGAQLVPLADFVTTLPQRDPGREVILYCKSGARSEQAGREAAAQGFDVAHLRGGVVEWVRTTKGEELVY